MLVRSPRRGYWTSRSIRSLVRMVSMLAAAHSLAGWAFSVAYTWYIFIRIFHAMTSLPKNYILRVQATSGA